MPQAIVVIAADCDTASLTLATADDDGNFTADFTLTVAEGGTCIGIGGGAGFQEQGGGFCVGVGVILIFASSWTTKYWC